MYTFYNFDMHNDNKVWNFPSIHGLFFIWLFAFIYHTVMKKKCTGYFTFLILEILRNLLELHIESIYNDAD